MGIQNILKREHEIVDYVFSQLGSISNIKILAGQHQDRLGVVSFYVDDLHFNLGVKLLNDKWNSDSWWLQLRWHIRAFFACRPRNLP
jgi:selenocysteine lyase/cysteine desulfurase